VHSSPCLSRPFSSASPPYSQGQGASLTECSECRCSALHRIAELDSYKSRGGKEKQTQSYALTNKILLNLFLPNIAESLAASFQPLILCRREEGYRAPAGRQHQGRSLHSSPRSS
jgi:hypothetical protein